MHKVSESYKEQMKALLRNRGYMSIVFGLVNQEAMASSTFESGAETYYSNLKNILARTDTGYEYATLEHDFWKADGSMYFVPREGVTGYYDVGFAGKDLVTEEGTTPLILDFNLGGTIDLMGLTIDFGDNYPIDFDVICSDGTVFEVRGNRQSDYETSQIFNDTDSLTFIFYTMRVSDTRARIKSLTLGVGLTYTNPDIIDSSFQSYVSPICESVPQYDLTITLQNYNQFFNVDNPDSAINFLETGQSLYVYYGLSLDGGDNIEWFQAARLYCSDWQSDRSSASISAQDIFRNLNNEFYLGEYYPDGISLYNLAEQVFEDAEIDDYYIDPYLKSIYTKNPMPRVSHKEALQIIANAGRCVLSQDVDGNPQIVSSFVPDYEVSSDDGTPYSHVENVKSKTDKYEYASLAQNYGRIDQSMYFVPNDLSGGLETGFVSEQISDDDGYFETNPQVVITFEAQYNLYSFELSFGMTLPASFTVSAYNQGVFEGSLEVTEGIEKEMTVYCEFESSFDVMIIEFTQTAEPHNRIVLNWFGMGEVTDFTMTSTDMMTAPMVYKQENVKEVIVPYYTYSESVEEKGTLANEAIVSEEGEMLDYFFTDACYDYSVTFGGSSTDVEIVSQAAYWLRIRFNVAKEAQLVIEAYRYTVTARNVTNKINTSGTQVDWDNPLISDRELATDLAEWLGEYYLEGIEYEYDTRGNPELEPNDIIYQENEFVDDMQVRLYDYTIGFNGAFSGKVQARRVSLTKATELRLTNAGSVKL